MKLYLSGPMSGVKDFNAPLFRKVTAELRGYGYEVVSPVEVDEQQGLELDGIPSGTTEHVSVTWGDCLSRDVKIIADGGIDAIVLLDGWQTSKGAKLEVFEGILLGLAIYQYNPSGRNEYAVLRRMAYSELFEAFQNSTAGVI